MWIYVGLCLSTRFDFDFGADARRGMKGITCLLKTKFGLESS